MPQDIMAIDPVWAWSPFEPSAEQPWNRRAAAHLCRRAGFGATSEELDKLVNRPPAEVARSFVENATAASQLDPEADVLATAMLATGNSRNLAAWWLHRMLNSSWSGSDAATSSPLLEKLTLFWHGHFATSQTKVRCNHLMLGQNETFRRLGTGPFGALCTAMVRDPAMLVWLDGRQSHGKAPNENFAREMLELFTLGEGHYSEEDIREAARCFTGWTVNPANGRSVFAPRRHDQGRKKLFGQAGKFGAL